jgi:hypothetical protein
MAAGVRRAAVPEPHNGTARHQRRAALGAEPAALAGVTWAVTPIAARVKPATGPRLHSGGVRIAAGLVTRGDATSSANLRGGPECRRRSLR